MLGYVLALSDQPKWSIDNAVRRFLRGTVPEHDGRFLPSSAEVARVVSAETERAERMAEARARHDGKTGRPLPRIRQTDWRMPFPWNEFRSWGLPEGTVFVADNATAVLPDGSEMTWTECRRRRSRQAA